MNKFPLKIIFFSPFLHCNVCDTLLQIKNVLQLIIEFLICAPISQHYDNLRFYTPLIAHFHKKNLLQIFLKNTLKMCCSEKCQTTTHFCLHYTMETP